MSDYGVIIHWTKCDPCRYFGEHQKQWHSWANREDIEWAHQKGHPDPSKQQCRCWCQRDVELPRRHLIHKGGRPRV
jgi:hypothetical protein